MCSTVEALTDALEWHAAWAIAEGIGRMTGGERASAMGHALRMRGYSGDIAAIERTAAGWVGVADPRRGGGAAGY